MISLVFFLIIYFIKLTTIIINSLFYHISIAVNVYMKILIQF